MIYSILNNPIKLNTLHFFTTMADLANGKPPLLELIARYQLNDDEATSKPLNFLLYEATT